MITIAGNARIFLYEHPVRMHKSFEGLCSIVEQNYKEPPVSGAYFVFLNRGRDKMKVLYWDNDGFAIWYKRLEKGYFSNDSDKVIMNRRDFFMLLEGITPKRLSRRFSLEKS